VTRSTRLALVAHVAFPGATTFSGPNATEQEQPKIPPSKAGHSYTLKELDMASHTVMIGISRFR
jgi:hypothetical protein